MPMPAQVVLPEGEPGQSVSVPIKETAFLQVGALFEARLVDVEVETGWLYSDKSKCTISRVFSKSKRFNWIN